MLFLLLVTTANALCLAAPRPAMPVMKLRGGVTGVDPTILAKTVYTLGIVKAVTFSMAPERSTKKLCNTEPSAVGIQTFKHRAMVMGMIITMSLCALWGMPPGMAVACGWAPYFCTQGARIVNGKYPMKKLFKLLLNVALAAVSYTDLGGKAWIAMLMFATIVALQGVPALYAPASVLSRGIFGKVTDKATDSEKGLVKLWGGTMASLAVLTASLALGKSALESVAYSLALQTAVQFESLFVSKGTMASDLKPWYVKMVLSSKSITCDFGMVPLTLMALIFLGML